MAGPDKRGRKAIVETVTPAMCKRIRQQSALGLSLPEIARGFGIGRTSLERMRKRYPELEEAYQAGRVQCLAKTAGKLRQLVNKGHIAAIIFTLKTQGGWSEVNGAPAARETEGAADDISPEELEARMRDAVKDWPEPLFRVVFDEYEDRHRCKVHFTDAVVPVAEPTPAEVASPAS